ncbi:MAG: DbpA RNA binding domain-containing protein [Steroidobacteraceae bacterium]
MRADRAPHAETATADENRNHGAERDNDLHKAPGVAARAEPQGERAIVEEHRDQGAERDNDLHKDPGADRVAVRVEPQGERATNVERKPRADRGARHVGVGASGESGHVARTEHPVEAGRDTGTGPAADVERSSRADRDTRGDRSTTGSAGARASRRKRGDGDEVVFETFRLEVGHAHGVKPGNIVGAIANEAGLEGRYIGQVDIRDDHSFVDLPEGMPKDIFRSLKKVRVAGQELRISRVDGKD